MSLWQIFKSDKPDAHQSKAAGAVEPKTRSNSVAKASSADRETTEGFKFKGFTENLIPTPFVDILPDHQLEELNQILNWNCFTVDSNGRRFGKPHSSTKRQVPQVIPDARIELMHSKLNLSDKSVLEIGCFEGVHTIALARLAKSVIAVDSRLENVVKTMVRLGFFDAKARVLCCDIEALDEKSKQFLKADVVHHVGVLYHLKDPVSHILALKEFAPKAIMLDTHYASPETATKSYTVAGETYRYRHFDEPGGYKGVFSGMYDHAKWLHIDDLQKALRIAGYQEIEIIELRDERNGPRLLLFAKAT